MRALVFFMLLVLAGCETRKNIHTDTLPETSVNLKYAEGFSVSSHAGHKLVEVIYPYQGAKAGYKYLLVPREAEVPPHPADVRVIRIPLTSIVCTSTSHIPLLDYLGETETLVGFPTTDYISSPKMRARIDAGKVQDLGIDKGLNLERLAMLQPDMVMGYTMTGDYGQFKKMEDLRIPVVLNADYLEKHPLGRAEWIKFMALFFDKEKAADSAFHIIEQNYLGALKRVEQVVNKPTVLSGVVYGDAWFMPGGQNYAARLFKDAGCRYLWEDTDSHGYLELSVEAVYEKAHLADLWIGVADFKSLQELQAADHRYAKFEAFQNRKVYTYDGRKGAMGGSEFLELGYLRPDIILNDLVKIAHPELMPSYELYFYKALE
jgi:iron complex transport system substrate-binding protein